MKNDLAARAKELALLLTAWPSVTGSAGEAEFAHRLQAQFLPNCFNENMLYGVEGGRANSVMLRRGKSTRTIVLTGHFDTVSFGDYGPLADLATNPEALTKATINRLRQLGSNPFALADLESTEFIAGRGLLDMKAGLAAGLAVLENYKGELSLLFIAVCDEEEKSAGARSVAPMLKQIEREFGLRIELVINLDAISDQGNGSKGRVVTYGSIGKQLLTAFVVGKQTHAGYPKDGVNAAYVMAELISEIELSGALSEETGSEVAAPPATLHGKDLKQGYNVTTPSLAFAYWNTMQHQRSGTDVLRIAMELAAKAVARAQAKTGHKIALTTFAELGLKPKNKLDPALSLPDQTLQAMMEVAHAIGRPTVVLGFGSIPYSAVLLRDQSLRKTISDAVKLHGLGEVNYFAGISDMSFFGETSGDLSVVKANTPIWGTGFEMPEPAGYPCINIGPWGRDYHTWLERVHAPYAFETLPRVLLSVIDAVARSG